MRLRLFLWAALWIAGTGPLAACPCDPDSVPPADYVFTGTCVYINTNWIAGGMKYSFEVQQSWGRRIDRYHIVSTPFDYNCGAVFEQGKTYLVYVRRKFTPKTDACMGTRSYDPSDPALAALGQPMPPSPSPLTGTMIWTVSILALLASGFLAFVVLRRRAPAR
jgi:hypothetical protein